jgi:hypothetical protein
VVEPASEGRPYKPKTHDPWTQSGAPGRVRISAEVKDDSGSEAEIVLAVAEAVWNFCQEVLGLDGTKGEVLRESHVDSPTGSHGEMGLPARLFNPRACCYAAEKNWAKGVILAWGKLALGPNR